MKIVIRLSLPRSVAVFMVLLLTWNTLPAQDTLAFNSLQVALKIIDNANHEVFRSYWKPEKGVEGLIATPFYFGEMHAGVQLKSFSGRDDRYPDFTSIYTFLGWGIRLGLPYKTSCHLGLRIGVTQMLFRGIEGYSHSESEVAATLNAVLNLPPYRGWTIMVSAGKETMFTYKRINLLQFSAGLGYTITTPAWFKEFLM